jgi:hypothetical protein
MDQPKFRTPEGEVDIPRWIEECLFGADGLTEFEKQVGPSWFDGWQERYITARWIVRCLGDPQCKGAREMVLALMARHKIEVTKEVPQ